MILCRIIFFDIILNTFFQSYLCRFKVTKVNHAIKKCNQIKNNITKIQNIITIFF